MHTHHHAGFLETNSKMYSFLFRGLVSINCAGKRSQNLPYIPFLTRLFPIILAYVTIYVILNQYHNKAYIIGYITLFLDTYFYFPGANFTSHDLEIGVFAIKPHKEHLKLIYFQLTT